MQWLDDNAVLVAFVFSAVVVLVAIVHLALRAWSLYKGAKRQMGRVTPLTTALQQEAGRLQARADAIPRRQAEIQASVVATQRHAAALGVMATHATQARRTLLAPLRYIGR